MMIVYAVSTGQGKGQSDIRNGPKRLEPVLELKRRAGRFSLDPRHARRLELSPPRRRRLGRPPGGGRGQAVEHAKDITGILGGGAGRRADPLLGLDVDLGAIAALEGVLQVLLEGAQGVE